jgi:ubiquinone/menaquinone biosynthesis C-methylase UbiE
MHEEWQLQGGAAELYQRYLVPAVTAGWAADLTGRAGLRPGERVLDVACGTGVVARAAAGHVGPGGRVAGLDLNPAMLAVARSLPGGQEHGICWLRASALALPLQDAGLDVVLCQLGLQFFPDRPAALAEMHRVLVPGGRISLSVFGAIEHNPATLALAEALDRHLGPGASQTKRAEHELADPALLRRLASEAGFRGVSVATATRLIRFSSPADYVRIQLSATPLASQAGEPGSPLAAALAGDVAAALEPYCTAGGLAFPQEALILMAHTD